MLIFTGFVLGFFLRLATLVWLEHGYSRIPSLVILIVVSLAGMAKLPALIAFTIGALVVDILDHIQDFGKEHK